MVKTPEEYFEDHLFDVVHAESTSSFTAAEAAFMSKYLGVNESEALERLGMDKAVEPECVFSPSNGSLSGLEGGGSAEPIMQEQKLSAAVAAVETVKEPLPVVSQPAPEAPAQAAMQDKADVSGTDAQKPEQQREQATVPEPVSEVAVKVPVATDDVDDSAPDWICSDMVREPDLLEQLRAESELQMVSFFLGKQEFTVPISTVQEVIRYITPTKLPVAPRFVRGVVNLRGSVTPIIQLRELLGISCDDDSGSTDKFIVVCKRHGLQFGLVIDSVHTMYRVPQESIDWAVESHLGVAVQYIFGLMKSDDMLIGIISVDNIVESILEG